MFIPRHIFHQILATFTACQGFILSGIWLGWPSAIIPKLRSGEIPLPVTDEDITWIVALMDLGNLLSPIPAGYLVDKRGRVASLRLSALLFILVSLIASNATTPFHLYAARFFSGVARGIVFTTVPPYVAEIAEPKIRGALAGSYMTFSGLGTACIMTFGPYISFDILNWASLILPINLLLLSLLIPESPYYYCMKSDEAAAEKAFAWFRDEKKETANKLELTEINKRVEHDVHQKVAFGALFTDRGNRRALKIVLAMISLQRLGGITCIIAYASTTLPTGGFWDAKITAMAFGWTWLIGGLLSAPLIDRFGRKPLLMVSAVLLAFTHGIMAIYFYYYQKTQLDMSQYLFVPHVCTILVACFLCIGVSQIPLIFQSELFPTNVRSQGSAFATIALSLSAFIVNKVYLSVGRWVGVYAMYTAFSAINYLGAFYTVFQVIETRGKSLVEIQDILNK